MIPESVYNVYTIRLPPNPDCAKEALQTEPRLDHGGQELETSLMIDRISNICIVRRSKNALMFTKNGKRIVWQLLCRRPSDTSLSAFNPCLEMQWSLGRVATSRRKRTQQARRSLERHHWKFQRCLLFAVECVGRARTSVLINSAKRKLRQNGWGYSWLGLTKIKDIALHSE